jgi:hypothetical protein
LTRFCLAIDIVDTAEASGGPILDCLGFAFFGVVFADIAFPEDGGSGRFGSLTLTLPCRDLFSICSHHGMLADAKA